MLGKKDKSGKKKGGKAKAFVNKIKAKVLEQRAGNLAPASGQANPTTTENMTPVSKGIIPGVSNKTLAIGAGLVGAYMLLNKKKSSSSSSLSGVTKRRKKRKTTSTSKRRKPTTRRKK